MPKKEMNTLVVGTNEYEIVDATARSSISSKQDTLVSGTNIKTINNQSLLGSGNITVGGDTNVIETVKVNNTALPVSNKAVNIDLSGYATTDETETLENEYSELSSRITTLSNFVATIESEIYDKQDTLISGANIKTINNTSLLGSGNIDIQSGGTYTAGDGIDITSNVVSNTAGMYLGDDSTSGGTNVIDADLLGGVAASNYATVNSLTSKQDVLVSGTNIKTINSTSLLGSGDIVITSGDANIIESISVNGTTQTITNKNVDLTVPTNTGDLTNNGDGTQGSLYATQTWVQNYIASLDANNTPY